MSNEKMKLSVIMPALNEEKNIINAVTNVLNSMDNFNTTGELIVINDGSVDMTEALVRDLMKNDNRISIIKHQTPQGIGASFWDGVDNAKGDMVIMMPGDNENDLSEMLKYVNVMENVDMVIPFAFNKGTRSISRGLISFLYRFIINSTFFTSLNYTNGTIIYRKSLLSEMAHREKSFFFQTDILIKLIKRGYLFAEVPYRLGQREKGRSKAVSLRSLYNVIKGYLKLVIHIYFKAKNKKNIFVDGSVSAKRYKELL